MLTATFSLTNFIVTILLLGAFGWWLTHWLRREMQRALAQTVEQIRAQARPIGEAFVDRDLTELTTLIREMNLRLEHVEADIDRMRTLREEG